MGLMTNKYTILVNYVEIQGKENGTNDNKSKQ
jgi:hypothetical protein